MNYLSHGVSFVDEPLVLAGTVVPDILSVVDRKCRVRGRKVADILSDTSHADPIRDVASGLKAHLDDDHWFHGSQAFLEVSGRLTRMFRDAMPDDESHRVGFLGHIVVELLLDRWLIEQNEAILDRFYDAFASANAHTVQETVGLAASRPTDRLVVFWGRFVEERFLADYVSSDRMFVRLNQVMRRVKLPPLDAEIVNVLDAGNDFVSSHATRLLPRRTLDGIEKI